jgi:hypothetical protein
MLPHRIRLRGPWVVTPTDDRDTPPAVLKMPAPWRDLNPLTGPVCFTRSFGSPAKLEPHERVWLLITGIRGSWIASLNGRQLGHWVGLTPPGSLELDISTLLSERNELGLQIETGAADAQTWSEVALEIRGLAWLDNLVARRQGDGLLACGLVRGPAGIDLDLYAIMGRRVAWQGRVCSQPEGTPFEIELAPIPAADASLSLHVELMHGGAVWHAANLVVEGV